jgi:dihydroorotase
MTLLIKGGTVVDPSQDIEKKADLLIEKGRIAGLGRIRSKKAWKILDAAGALVLPGLVDMHTHLREPGREDKETIETGSRAAVAGGFTSIACMPNTSPVNDCEAVTRFILEKAKKANLANIFPVGAITKGLQGKELAEIGEMTRSGAVAFSDDGMPVLNNQIMRRAMEYSKIFDVPILDHCEDVNLAASGYMNESSVSTQLGLRGLSGVAEEIQVVRDIILARLVQSKVHICHISTREAIRWVRNAKAEGIRVTCEAAPHHFALTDEAVRSYDTNLKVNPPLRTREDVEAVLEGLADGTIDCIASDHAPHTVIEKDVPFEDAANGLIGMETMVSLVCEFLLRKQVISVSRMVELMSLNPSKILGIPRGTLRKGEVADVSIVDPDLEIIVDKTTFASKGRNCPFDGWKLRGAPLATIVGGRTVWQRKS